MIDPDLIKISLIPDSKLTMLEVENVSKINSQNKFFKIVMVSMVFIAVSLITTNYFNREKEQTLNT